MVVTNSPPSPRSAHNIRANSSGLFRGLERSHSNWSTRDMLPTWMLSCRTEEEREREREGGTKGRGLEGERKLEEEREGKMEKEG